MLIIEYDSTSDSSAMGDGNVMDFAEGHINITQGNKNGSYSVFTSNALLLLAFGVLVKEGKIPHEKIRFKFGDKIFPIDKNGRFSGVPPIDIHLDLIIRLL